MHDFIQFVYTVGSPALILGIVVFGLYKIVIYFFDRYFEDTKGQIQKDIERFKSQLENEKQAFIYNLSLKQQESKIELDKMLHEHQIKFSSLYVERNKVINKLFGLLVLYLAKYETLAKCIRLNVIDCDPEDNIEDIEKQIYELNKEILAFYSPNKLYFKNDLSLKVNHFITDIKESVFNHIFYLKGKDLNNDIDFYNIICNHLEMYGLELKEIEIEFRKILGVD